MNAKIQSEMLMNELLLFAKKMLAELGGFHPFGGYLTIGMEVVHVGVQSDENQSDPIHKIDIMCNSFETLASTGNAIAFAVVTDVNLSHRKTDAIKFFLEHVDGYCAEVFFCYKKSIGTLEITSVFAQQGTSKFFVSGTAH